MVAGKKTKNIKGSAVATPSPKDSAFSCRNLNEAHLAGVVFGCTNSTINECLTKQLFGLPAPHFSYVKNIRPGLTLFLFNYSTRVLHGIFEAASPGQLSIDPYGWTTDGSQRTHYPAQVQIRVQKNCQPLSENQFKPIIKQNYYTPSHFWFELDLTQVTKLISLFSNQEVPSAPAASVLRKTGNWQIKIHRPPQLKKREDEENNLSIPSVDSTSCNQLNGHMCITDPTSLLDGVNQSLPVVEKDEAKRIYEKLLKLAAKCEPSDSSETSQVQESSDAHKILIEADGSQEKEMTQEESIMDSPLVLSDLPSIVAQLMQEVQELKAFRQEDNQKMSQLEQKLVKSESEVQQLKDRCMMLESMSNCSGAYTYGTIMESCSELHLDPEDSIFIAGGYDGKSWLSSLDSYSPSKDIIKSLKPMTSVRSYSSVAVLKGEIYVIGGGNGESWYDTAESYNPVYDEWTSLPCLNGKKGSLAATTLHDKIFAIGGGNGEDCFSNVEMFDLDVGKWISARSMLQQRFALAAVELNGAVYAVGGFDGNNYLRSAERFDPREYSWSKLESMNSKRGSHSLVLLNEKLYAVGGFDGSAMVSSVEVFDPRYGKWVMEAPMKYARGYSVSVVLNNSLYVIGGVEHTEKIVEQIEQYKEGHGWQVTNLKAVGKRCFASGIVL